jgi:hypothetical protein
MLELGEALSLADLIETAHVAEKQLDGLVWFRGHADCDWSLIPSAHRRHPALESQFANHFRLRAPSLSANCPGHMDYVSWLPLMQHYGIPTRLLDWTESLLFAAFFAITKKSQRVSATIWMLAPSKLNELSIGHLIPFLTDERIKPVVTAAFSGAASHESHESQHSISVLAPRTDRRMAAQLGNYTIHGNRDPLELHPASSRFLARVIIPETSHGRIKESLNNLPPRL